MQSKQEQKKIVKPTLAIVVVNDRTCRKASTWIGVAYLLDGFVPRAARSDLFLHLSFAQKQLGHGHSCPETKFSSKKYSCLVFSSKW